MITKSTIVHKDVLVAPPTFKSLPNLKTPRVIIVDIRRILTNMCDKLSIHQPH